VVYVLLMGSLAGECRLPVVQEEEGLGLHNLQIYTSSTILLYNVAVNPGLG
jgi:hypothetical protein